MQSELDALREERDRLREALGDAMLRLRRIAGGLELLERAVENDDAKAELLFRVREEISLADHGERAARAALGDAP